jgi:hypothetical protein
MNHQLYPKIQRKNLLKIVFALICCGIYLSSLTAYAQKSTINNAQINLSTPQTYDFNRYGNTPVSYYTGEINVSIPVYTYQDNDFTIPVSIGYNSSGFLPNKRASIVGLNWFLNAGGVISRQVNGLPDECEQTATANGDAYIGGFAGYSANKSSKYKNLDDLYNFNNYNNTNQIFNIDGCEIEPDKFTFSMPSHNGSFIIQNNGQARCLENKPYKIDLSELRVYSNSNMSTIASSKIKITTDDGYIYEFGGCMDALEIGGVEVMTSGTAKDIVVNAWHLSKITSPNGRIVSLHYKTGPNNLSNNVDPNSNFYLTTLSKIQNVSQTSQCDYFSMLASSTTLCSTASYNSCVPSINVHSIKTVYLNDITVDNTTSINFNYSPKSTAFYTDSNDFLGLQSLQKYNQNMLQLDSVSVKYNGQLDAGKSCSLVYQNLGGSYGSRQFLTSVQKKGENPYQFTYYETDKIPYPLVNKIDYWGFWKGGYSTSDSFLPDVSEDSNGDFTYGSAVREPDTTYCRVALLKEIYYPTKGKSSYFYEPHSYSYRLERRSSSSFIPLLFSASGYAGGARIKRIIDDNADNNLNVREFRYVDNFLTGGSSSSGVLLDWPRYRSSFSIRQPGITADAIVVQNNSFNTNYYPGENFIHYSEVTEISSTGNGCVNYQFTNYKTNPDDAAYIKHQTWTKLYDPTNPNLAINSTLKLSDRSFERGKPKSITYCKWNPISNTYSPVKNETTTYTQVAGDMGSYWVGVTDLYKYAEAYKIYSYAYLPLSIQTTVYNSNGQINTTSENTYNVYNQISKNTMTTSDGTIVETGNVYPQDIAGSSDAGLNPIISQNINIAQNLVNKNMFTPIMQNSTCKNGKITSVNYNLYNTYSANIYLPQTRYMYTVTNPFEDCQSFNALSSDISSDYKSMSVEDNKNTEDEDNFTVPSGYTMKISYNGVFEYDNDGTGGYFEILLNGSPVVNSNSLDYTDYGDYYHKEYAGTLTLTAGTYTITLVYHPSGYESVPFYFYGAYAASKQLIQYKFNDNLQPATTYDYDSKGHLRDIAKYGCPHTVYLWSYNYMYPVAKIEGISYSELLNSFPQSSIDNLAQTVFPSRAQIEAIRTALAGKSVLISTYSYIPLTGMATVTDPKCITTTFSYDNLGRLKTTQNNDNQILNAYDYHYK